MGVFPPKGIERKFENHCARGTLKQANIQNIHLETLAHDTLLSEIKHTNQDRRSNRRHQWAAGITHPLLPSSGIGLNTHEKWHQWQRRLESKFHSLANNLPQSLIANLTRTCIKTKAKGGNMKNNKQQTKIYGHYLFDLRAQGTSGRWIDDETDSAAGKLIKLTTNKITRHSTKHNAMSKWLGGSCRSVQIGTVKG